MTLHPCPCGTGEAYASCCGPLHRGDARAATALQLMKSRFSAFARGEVDYLVDTHHPDHRGPRMRDELEAGRVGTRWLDLEILDHAQGEAKDSEGAVHFRATYRRDGRLDVLEERSRFRREGGAWYYLDGVHAGGPPARTPISTMSKIGRNDPCHSGSGKKYKKCHLAEDEEARRLEARKEHEHGGHVHGPGCDHDH